jgi:hypothetical protein
MSTIKITGNPIRHRIWKYLLEKSQTSIKAHENTVIDITSVNMYTPSLIVIKFLISNTGKKYELIFQGKYSETYKKITTGGEALEDLLDTKMMVRTGWENAFEIN